MDANSSNERKIIILSLIGMILIMGPVVIGILVLSEMLQPGVLAINLESEGIVFVLFFISQKIQQSFEEKLKEKLAEKSNPNALSKKRLVVFIPLKIIGATILSAIGITLVLWVTSFVSKTEILIIALIISTFSSIPILIVAKFYIGFWAGKNSKNTWSAIFVGIAGSLIATSFFAVYIYLFLYFALTGMSQVTISNVRSIIVTASLVGFIMLSLLDVPVVTLGTYLGRKTV